MDNLEMLTFEEVKKFLRVSNSTLYRLVQGHRIPASKVGRSWRFRRDKIEWWLEEKEKA